MLYMAKQKQQFLCSECGDVFGKWSGQCGSCKEWNTLKDFKEAKVVTGVQEKLAHKISTSVSGVKKKLSLAKKTTGTDSLRISSGISEFDRVLGGGFFPGSITLLTGDPGIGKSTLSLQACISIAKKMPDKKVIIISGEESENQISDRLFRISEKAPKNLFLLAEGILETAMESIPIEETGFILFDSVQTLASLQVASLSGSMAQSTAVTERIMIFSKKNNIPTMLIGHVTKTGEMAGPQTMAHLVDTVLHIEGDDASEYRIVKSRKNRFGSVSEMGVFEMGNKGMIEVKNPSKSFLSGRLKNAIGSSIYAGIEGSRPFLIEVQALSSPTSFGYPKRSTSGFDANRLSILLAVLSRFTMSKLDNEDVFINVVGGLKLNERAADMAILAALISSKKKQPLPEKTIFFGEVGLSGEIRNGNFSEKRLAEAEKLGFTQAVIPFSAKILKGKIECVKVKTVQDLEKWVG